jgi:hypothetical protein
MMDMVAPETEQRLRPSYHSAEPGPDHQVLCSCCGAAHTVEPQYVGDYMASQPGALETDSDSHTESESDDDAPPPHLLFGPPPSPRARPGSRAGRVWGDRSRCAVKRCDVCLHLRRRWRAADAPDPVTDAKTVMLADDTLAVGTTLEAVEEHVNTIDTEGYDAAGLRFKPAKSALARVTAEQAAALTDVTVTEADVAALNLPFSCPCGRTEPSVSSLRMHQRTCAHMNRGVHWNPAELDGEWEVRAITATRGGGGKPRFYKVHWKGYPATPLGDGTARYDWEPELHLGTA